MIKNLFQSFKLPFLVILLFVIASILGFFSHVKAADLTYSTKVYRKVGGDEMVVANGGAVTVESGGAITVESGGLINVESGGTITFATDGKITLPEINQLIISTEITTAEVLALNGTPFTLINAPGSNKAIIFKGAMLFVDYAGTAYDNVAGGEDLIISYTDGSGVQVARVETTGFIDQANDEVRYVVHHSTATGYANDFLPVANATLTISLLSGEILTGNSPLKIQVVYAVLPTAW